MLRLVPILLLSACATPEPAWRPPHEPGPYTPGVATWAELDDRSDHVMTMEVWYPAVVDHALEKGRYAPPSMPGNALRDARLDTSGGPYGLLAFSHGYGGIRHQSAALCEHLASHGFVVVSVDHPRNTMFDLDADATTEVAVRRPGDIAFALDVVVERWGDHVEDERVGAVGHSFGAVTALLVGGGEVDIAGAAAHCENDRTRGCNFFDLSEDVDASAAVPDPRVQAVAALAPGAWYIFGEHGEGLSSVRTPLVLAGDKDGDLPYESELRPTWAALPAGSPMLTLHGAGHWAFSDLCSVITSFEDCAGEDGGFMDPARVLALTQASVTAHMQVHVLGEQRSQPWTEAGAWQDDDVTWELAP